MPFVLRSIICAGLGGATSSTSSTVSAREKKAGKALRPSPGKRRRAGWAVAKNFIGTMEK